VVQPGQTRGDRIMNDGFQFIDIIFFAMIAAFLVLRLRNVLGRRNGLKGQPRTPFPFQGQSEDDATQEQSNDNIVHLTDPVTEHTEWEEAEPEPEIESEPESNLSTGLTQIKRADPSFGEEDFLSGARMAFEMIIDAFATGTVSTLKAMLNSEVFGNFAQAIQNREQAGETLDHTLVGIKTAEIVEAFMDRRDAAVTVKFVSEQASVTLDADGAVVDGDPSAVNEVTDFWTFARDTGSKDPNWTLVATGSLE
jgi:predicted lipid-binding transport protein (Tim44 family)